jgi:hypothetical protein
LDALTLAADRGGAEVMDGSQIAGIAGFVALWFVLVFALLLGGYFGRRRGHIPWFDDTPDEAWRRYWHHK